ncbi:hypothetical protein [Chryseobacterium gwangjuense]|uniref:hypothetical protein n=1 Tax=Chryseobacterium gwangjuense TaxID=1069980 RepID=UPI001E5E692D|nr:hypothetical protein [Chryseobacterium gwangjuense]MCE3076117.1 hypothetical protein [Chryseobacterium gwangjuense]
MKRKIFKYKSITRVVLLFGFIMLLILGFSTVDTYNLFKSESSNITFGEYLVSAFLGFLFLVCFVSLILVAIKSQKSILVLNIFYGCIFILLLGAWLVNIFAVEEGLPLSDHFIILGLCGILIFLLFLINKFKYKEIQYESIESIGTQKD